MSETSDNLHITRGHNLQDADLQMTFHALFLWFMSALSVEDPGAAVMMADDGKPYTALAYANGPGWYNHRNFSVRVNQSEWDESDKPSTGEVLV